MYEKFFNFTCKPFELLPNPDFLFPSRSHKKAITYLDYGIKEKVGFILLSGEVGAGKTTLVRNLVRNIRNKAPLAIVFNNGISSDQLIHLINEDFGLPVEGKSKIDLMRDLNSFLIDEFGKGQLPVLIIDEAQNLSAEHLEEIRLLSNLETETSKLLQIILVGQPEIRTIIARPELRQLRQRISVSCRLNPLTRQETEEYILYRMEVAGNRGAVKISKEVFDAIHNYSRGIPRLINIISDFLLVSAYADEVREISPELTREVLGDIEKDHGYWTDRVRPPQNFPPEAWPTPELMEEIHRDLQTVEEKLATFNPDEYALRNEIKNLVDETSRTFSSNMEEVSRDLRNVQRYVRKLSEEIAEIKKKFAEGSDKDPQASPKKVQPGHAGFFRRIFG